MEINRFALENKIAKLRAALDKKIEADNSKFAQMSKKKQRVAIANDVLASLKAGLFKAERGQYLDVHTKSSGKTTCNVCAIGSMFAACRLRAGADIQDLYEESGMHSTLAQYFEPKVLGLVESAFERTPSFANEECNSDEDAQKAARYTKGLSAEKALEKIMKNIVKHDGDFVLED